mmetsp:Transcript_30043/g.82471  ORF Transcript_30043/g.82471 Transcript_30043/m.82471 type:complete len:341 (-) Transcript_30043:238-1260(-)
MLHGHESPLHGGAQARDVHLRVRKNLRQEIKQVEYHGLAISRVHEDVVRQRQEGVLQVRHDEHLRLAPVRTQVVKVYGRIEGYDADLDARPARKPTSLDHFFHRIHDASEHAGDDRSVRHVDHKHEDGRLGRSYHVLSWSDVLDCSPVKLGPLEPIRSLSHLVQTAEVAVQRHLRKPTHIARPSPAVLLPLDEGVDICPATFAPDDGPNGTEVERRYVFHPRRGGRERLQDDSKWHFGILLSAHRVRHFVYGRADEMRGAVELLDLLSGCRHARIGPLLFLLRVKAGPGAARRRRARWIAARRDAANGRPGRRGRHRRPHLVDRWWRRYAARGRSAEWRI